MLKAIASILLFSQILMADDVAPDFLGTHSFSKDDLKVVQVQHQVSVYMRNDDARKYVKDLTSQGYQCLLGANSVNKCKKFERSVAEDQDLRADVIREFSKQVLNFELSNDQYELINDAPAVKEFEKSQNSSFGNESFNKIHLYALADGKVKIKLFHTGHEDQCYFYLNTKGDLSQQVTAVRINQKQNANVVDDRMVYLYEAVWKL